jgi:hypothetical protein
MTYTERLSQWVVANRSALEQLGRLWQQGTSDDRVNPSAHVALERPDGSFVELLVWDSGEAEFGYGERAPGADEHHELANPEEFEELLRQFMARATR